CKLSFYIHRVARGISLCTTCLLSGFQAVTISPSNSRWAELKPKAPKFVKPSCLLCWILHLLINIIVPVRVTSPRNATNITEKDFGLCSVKGSGSFTSLLYAFLFSFLDILCLAPMGWASGSIVLFLHRHKQRLQYIHHTSLSPRASPETTATYTVLLLVTSFVSFHSVSSILSLYMTHFVNPSLRLVNVSTFLAACFPAFSPFVLISCDTRIFRTYVSCGKTKISK
ncbi:vomeronasal type-1 receptor 4-like, partial [Trichechus inunguis]